MATGIGEFFEIDDWSRSTYTSTRTWDIFEAGDGELMYLMGLVETDQFLLTVIMASPADVSAEYETLVFFPAMDAIQATG